MKNLLASLMLTVALAASAQTSTTTTLVADKQSGALGTIFTLTATVTDAQGPLKLGRVTFYDGDPSGPAAALGTVVLNGANGTATLKRAFTIGSHSITAKFLGTNTDAPSSSSSPTITVTGQYASKTVIFTQGSGSSLSLVGKVSGQGPIAATGTVTFIDLTTNTGLGTSTLNTPVPRSSFSVSQTLTYFSGLYDAYILSTVTGDFNNDGRLDLIPVLQEYPNQIRLQLGNGDGTFQDRLAIAQPTYSPVYVTAGDFNGDGKLDLAAAVNGPDGLALDIALGHGNGTFTWLPPVTLYSTIYSYPVTLGTLDSMAIGDFNGDGKLDLVVAADGPGAVAIVLLGHGNGTFDVSEELALRQAGGSGSIVVGDFSGDGKDDIAANDGELFLGHGNGTFADAIVFGNPGDYSIHSIAAGDLNGDGRLDLLVLLESSYQGTSFFQAFLNHGNGTFEEVDTPVEVGSTFPLAVADFNGDGKLDVAVGTYNLCFGHGDGTFLGTPPVYIGIDSFDEMFLGDLNNDGIPDLTILSGNSISAVVSNPASISAASLSGVTLTGSGSHTISATYSGDENFTGSTGQGVVKQP
jgi:hypothetical protein